MSIQMLSDADLDAVSGGDSVHITNDISVSNTGNNVIQGVGVANALGGSATATGVNNASVNVHASGNGKHYHYKA